MGSRLGTIDTIWSTPLLIVLICYFIYNEVGVAMFAGVGIILTSLPVSGFLASFARKLQLQQMKDKDNRIKLLNEVLSGMQVIKMYGWEPPFIKQTLDIRNSEIKVLKKVSWFYAIVLFISNCLPFLFGLSAFTVYIFMNDGQVLEPQKTFVVLSYLSLIRVPLMRLLFLVSIAIQASASLKRINKFTNNSEVDINAVQRNSSSNDMINIRDGTFKWDPSDKSPFLNDINISVKSGSLTAIVGAVGSGKSSLISACLGEMVKCSGAVGVTILLCVYFST